ncbi:MAG: hypothetical protein KJ831_12070, partial [Candidatus Eisenbacteria bacterium]|nr:hypothetical protein [Candidatus Eisenbacteria bacterium]
DISESNPAVVYAIYADDPGYFMGLYKTSNGGDSWSRVNDGALSDLYSSYGWYFGNVRVDPNLPDRIYAMGLYGYKSTNSGGSWSGVTFSVHADQHDWWISPNNSNWIISAHDGGLDISTNGGGTWSKVYNLPVTQFYAGTIDYTYPERLYGGTQDNGTLRTLTGGLDDWDEILGGDGFYVIVDPTNPNTIYAEWQWGNLNKSVDGGFYFSDALNGISSSNRRNWSTPVVMDPSDPQTLYYGTYKIYKTTNGASYWSPISPDLSNGPGSGNLTFGTITTIAVAPSDPAVIYAGLDDGNVWRTLNGGSEWLKVSGDLPVRWVTRVAVDPLDPLTAYVTLSGYRQDESLPHIFRTTDAGALWEDISGNLPEVPINAVVIDPEHSTWLYVATDAGVYFTGDLGATWAALGEGLPLVTVHDLTLHAPTRTLVAATHGRSLFRLNLGTVSAPEHENTAWRLLRIEPPSPTPFSLLTTLRFHLETAHTVTASVYDVRGRRVKSWEYVSYPAGSHSLVWDGCDESGRRLSSGTYWIRLRAGDENRSVRALLVD